MRLLLATTLAALLTADNAKGDGLEETQALSHLRLFARNQLHGPLVKYTRPRQRLTKNTLTFSYGEVTANADLAILLQLRVELLREFPLFGKEVTEETLAELEAIVERCLATRDQLDRHVARRPNPEKITPEEIRLNAQLKAIQLDFDQVCKKHALGYAERKGLDLTVGDAFGDGDYLYIDRKRQDRKSVSYATIKKAVDALF